MNIRYSTEEFCSICYDSYEESPGHDAVRLNCQHAFGRKCIVHWALESNKCPVCGLATIPAELRGRERIFRRLENRTIFDPATEQKMGLFAGLCSSLCLGCLVAVDYKINPDREIGNGVAILLVAAATAAGCGASMRGPDPRTLYYSSCSLGAAIGYGLSALFMWIVTTLAQSS